jgi:zinc transporter ZupT
VHKLIEDFVVGFQLARKNESVYLVVSLTISMSLMTPLGGALGILIQNAPIRTQAHDLFILCCQGTTAGTFIYVSFFIFWAFCTFYLF